MSRLKTDAIRNVNASVDGINLDTSGNVGLGTTSPNTKLHVEGTGTIAEFKSTNNNYLLQLKGNNSANYVYLGTTSSNDYLIANNTNGSGFAERLRIKSDGKIGIGTSTPEDLLHIKSGKIRIENAIVSNNDSTISYDDDTFLVDIDPNNVRGSSAFQVKVDTVSGLIIDDNRHATFGGRIKINDFIETSVNNSNLKLNSAGSSGQIKFHINGSEKAKFDSSGNFQINNDSGKITVGLGADLQLFHDGGSSIIRNTNNNASLYLQGSSSGTNNIRCYANGGTVLYWNGETNLYTAEDAVRMNDNVKLELGNASDLEIFHDGGDSYVRSAGVGALSLESSSYVDVKHTSAGTDPVLRMVNEANTTAGAVNVIRSIHDVRTCAEIRMGRNNDNNDFSAAAAATQGDIQFWTTQGGSLSRKGTFINSGGLCFGTDTAAANALNDYEEGTFSFNESTISVSNYGMKYVKIGKMVYLTGRIVLGNTSDTGILNMTGIPFTPNTDVNNSAQHGYVGETNLTNSLTPVHLALETSSSTVRIRTDNYTALQRNQVAGYYFRFSMWYLAAS